MTAVVFDLPARLAALARVIALINEKGGVGKTTICANVAGQCAAAGYRVLVIDLNRQANIADDLGYRDQPGVDDDGAGLMMSLMLGTPLTPVATSRPNLWVVPGGEKLDALIPLLLSRIQQAEGREAFLALALALAPVAGDFDAIFIDCPPENPFLEDLALAASRWVLMPTKSDTGGVKGMTLVARRFAIARQINPALDLLGVVLFGSGTSASAIRARVRQEVADAFGFDPMLDAFIRHSEGFAEAGRKQGRLAHELEVDAKNQPAWWQSLREGRPPAQRVPGTAASVSADFRDLAAEVLAVLARQEGAAS